MSFVFPANISKLIISPGSIEETLKEPLKEALEQYRDNPGNDDAQGAYKTVWNQVQKEVGRIWNLKTKKPLKKNILIHIVQIQLKCCGVEDARDWTNCAECGFGNAGSTFKVGGQNFRPIRDLVAPSKR